VILRLRWSPRLSFVRPLFSFRRPLLFQRLLRLLFFGLLLIHALTHEDSSANCRPLDWNPRQYAIRARPTTNTVTRLIGAGGGPTPDICWCPRASMRTAYVRRIVHSTHGLMTSMPQPSKSFALRVARLAPCERVIAAMVASNWLMGRPVDRRDAPICA